MLSNTDMLRALYVFRNIEDFLVIKSILIEAKKQEKEMMNLTFESFFNRQHIEEDVLLFFCK